MISIKQTKEIRVMLGLTHIVIFGIDRNKHQVTSHGGTVAQSKEACKIAAKLKDAMEWPREANNSTPLARICCNCSFWQRGYHRPGTRISDNQDGKCMFTPEPTSRSEKDRACGDFEPTV